MQKSLIAPPTEMSGGRFEGWLVRCGSELVLNEQAERLAKEVNTALDSVKLAIKAIEPDRVALINFGPSPSVEKCDQSINDNLGLRRPRLPS